MRNRYYFFAAIAALLILGSILVAAKLYWNPSQNGVPGDNNILESEKRTVVPEAPEIADSPRPAPAKVTSENSREEGFPNIINLLKTSRRTETFGSYQIKGIIVYDAVPESSSATIEDLSNNTSRIHYLNDILSDNSRLVAIHQDHIVLEKNGIRKRIYIQQTRITRGGTRSLASANDPNGYQKIRDNEYNLNPYRVFRGDADKVLDFSMKLTGGDGRQDGIQIYNISDDSLARKLGLKENDVLLSVNKKPVDGILDGINACINAYNSDDLQLEILRGNEVLFLTYHLFWEGQGAWTASEVLGSKAVSSLLKGGLLPGLF